MHSVFRLGYPIKTDSIDAPPSPLNSHLRVVPASAVCSRVTVKGQSWLAIEFRRLLGRFVMASVPRTGD